MPYASKPNRSKYSSTEGKTIPARPCATHELEGSFIPWDLLFHQCWGAGSDISLYGRGSWPSSFLSLTIKLEFLNSQSPFENYEWEHLQLQLWPHHNGPIYAVAHFEAPAFKDGMVLFHWRVAMAFFIQRFLTSLCISPLFCTHKFSTSSF